jgi:adenylate cyclase
MASCAECGVGNPGGARFCMGCGAALERRCATCGSPAPEGASFCMSCGAALAGPEPAASAGQGARADVAEGAGGSQELDERRTATVLFADLSGYTAIAEELDPESVKRLLERILTRLSEEVQRYGGYVDKFIGDNVMAIFGAPVAHGDDAERAVRAGLGMQAAMDEVNEPLAEQHGVTFALCVGINTGEVLAGHVGDSYTVIGDSVNVAARLQAAARLGTVTVGESTFQATREAIEYDALEEPLELKGKAQPVYAWEALRPGRSRAAAESVAAPVRAPLVGRGKRGMKTD